MFLLRRPTQPDVRRFLDAQARLSFSYPEVGASRVTPPLGYTIDQNRIKLGQGAEVFSRAVEALTRWEMFNLGWIQLCWPDAPIEANCSVAIVARHFGFYSLNACRIVYVIDEDGLTRKYGFAYGTLPDHAEKGEEQFTVEWRRSDDSVWYEIQTFSRPNQFLARIAYPITRHFQKRFAEDSKRAMIKAVG